MSESDGPPPVPIDNDDDARKNGGQLELFNDIVELERQRITTEDNKTNMLRFMIEKNDEADERQFQYHMTRLEKDDADNSRRYRFASRFLGVAGVFSMLVLSILVWMAFLGDESQRQIALRFFEILLIGAGGFGVITALVLGARRMLRV